MIQLTQTKLSNEEGTINGNCLRTCIACLLEIDPEEIPHIEDMDVWFGVFYDFLNSKGYEFEGTIYLGSKYFTEFGKRKAEDEIKRFKEYEGVDGYIIAGGTSPRSYVTRGHAVIYKNGELAWDPHYSREGVLEITEAYMIKRKS